MHDGLLATLQWCTLAAGAGNQAVLVLPALQWLTQLVQVRWCCTRPVRDAPSPAARMLHDAQLGPPLLLAWRCVPVGAGSCGTSAPCSLLQATGPDGEAGIVEPALPCRAVVVPALPPHASHHVVVTPTHTAAAAPPRPCPQDCSELVLIVAGALTALNFKSRLIAWQARCIELDS